MIPCFNEASTIGKVVRDFKKALPEAVVYVYDNNSTDGTAEIAAKAGAVVRHEYRQGKGNVMRRMFREVDAKCCLMVDGDDTYPAEAAPVLCREVLERQADMVIGDRLSSTYFTENKRPFHNFGNSLVRRLVNTIFKADIKDVMTGYRAMSYRFVKTFPVLSKGFEIETEMTIHTLVKNMSCAQVVIDYQDRPAGSASKLKTLSDGTKVIWTIFKLFKNYRPLVFFSLLACLPLAVGIVYFAMARRVSSSFVCAVSFAALSSVFVGLALNTLAHKDRRDFEMALNHAEDRLKDLMKNPNFESHAGGGDNVITYISSIKNRLSSSLCVRVGQVLLKAAYKNAEHKCDRCVPRFCLCEDAAGAARSGECLSPP